VRNGFFVIDADGHACDFEPMYRQRLPEEFRKRNALSYADGFDRTLNGKLVWNPANASENLRDNDQEGIDVQILYPTGGLELMRNRDRDYVVAFCQTYNDWLKEWCSANPDRLKGVALAPLHLDVKAAIEEVERAVTKLGMVGVMVNTYDRTRNVGHRDFWPFYEACTNIGIPVSFHASGSDTLDPVCHFDNFLAIHTFSHVPEQMLACTAVIYSGMLEEIPGLRVAFLESGCGWVPFWMEHMDEEWEKRRHDAPLMKASPSEYMTGGRVYVAAEPEEKMIPYVAEHFPASNLLFASDYPHWDGDFPHAVAKLADRMDVSDELKRKIFFENPKSFYNLKIEAPVTTGAGTA
jgi:predicted TIM-barrel fold metal-dependent hydrolase